VNHSYDKPYYGLASVHSKKGETEEAIKWHRKCIEVNPNNISALNALGTLLASKEHYDEAV
jgi:Tfp pilus assembly protein PilF